MDSTSTIAPRHFITLLDLSPLDADHLLTRASELKQMQRQGIEYLPLQHRSLGMIFEKSSTRTRVSFEVGMTQLGGHALFLSSRDTQLGRGEPVADSARVLSRMVDAVMIRTFDHEVVETFAHYSTVPVINALTNRFHPCQLLADMQTYREHRGSIQGRKVAYIGDGNNMCHSYLNASSIFDFQLTIACPNGFEPDASLLAKYQDRCQFGYDPVTAVAHADLVVTDVWASMGQEEETQQRRLAFKNYCVDAQLMQRAHPDALFMHCLPAHRGEEVTDEVLESSHSVVWDEAENRLHAQKALLEYLLVNRDHT
jgi:ornithine carbamoyltransferase